MNIRLIQFQILQKLFRTFYYTESAFCLKIVLTFGELLN